MCGSVSYLIADIDKCSAKNAVISQVVTNASYFRVLQEQFAKHLLSSIVTQYFVL